MSGVVIALRAHSCSVSIQTRRVQRDSVPSVAFQDPPDTSHFPSRAYLLHLSLGARRWDLSLDTDLPLGEVRPVPEPSLALLCTC